MSKKKKHFYTFEEALFEEEMELPSVTGTQLPEDTSKKGQFRCENCSRTYKRLTDYNSHKKSCSTTKNVQCTICKMAFYTIFGLRQHMRKLHALVKQYVCEECGRNFYVLEDLEKHRSNHKEQQCTECGKTYANIKQLRRHLDCHSNNSYVCTVCGMTLNTRHTLNHHMKKHSEILIHICNYCGKKFKMSKALKIHLISHSGLRPYKCLYCDKTFSDNSICRVHMRNLHSTEILSGESTSGIAIIPVPSLRELQETAKSQETPVRDVKQYGDRTIHVVYGCEICPDVFTTPYKLKTHMVKHDEENYKHKCNFCEKTFKTSNGLKSHYIHHSGRRPYKCQFCEKTFTDSAIGRNHMRNVHRMEYNMVREQTGKPISCIVLEYVPSLMELHNNSKTLPTLQ